MSPDEAGFLAAIQATPEDGPLRLVYADWLEERGDARADFLRLHLILKSLGPDHPHRVLAEHQLSEMRVGLDPAWRVDIEPEHAFATGAEGDCERCACFAAGEAHREWSAVDFHFDTQDTRCDGWKQLLETIDKAAAEGNEYLHLLGGVDEKCWHQIVTLPATIARLKKVRQLDLYGSWLVRIPPEIGEMASLENFDSVFAHRLHWFPYEITRCSNLKGHRASPWDLYGNWRSRPPFPRLQPYPPPTGHAGLTLKRWGPPVRGCSVCAEPFEDRGEHRVWVTLVVGNRSVPLLVNACSEDCVRRLPAPPDRYLPFPHRGGPELQQPPRTD